MRKKADVREKPTASVSEADFDLVMRLNVKSVFLGTQAVVPRMLAHGGGSIINIASVGASRPRPGLVWYNASKAAVSNVRPFFPFPFPFPFSPLINPPHLLYFPPPKTGNERSSSRIRPAQHPGEQHQPAAVRNGPVRDVRGRSRHAGEPGQVPGQRAHGPADGAERRRGRVFVLC